MNIASKLNYRPDIDGLRAIAVLSVLFYHAGIGAVSGGFVGVDVFFVISGFLITSIIVREVEAGEFSIVRFYERRIRRIYPALYVVLAAVLLAALLLYGPDVFKEVSLSALAATFFVSNILFWDQAGYFDSPSSLKPLLHTWSLAVEEQFYIVFPWVVYLLMRFAKKQYKAVLTALTVISFALSVYYVKNDATSAFYFFHLRAWELMLGSLLAVNLIPPVKSGAARNVLSLAGMGMIVFSVFEYSHNTSFPGLTALLPTLGSTLIIYTGGNDTTLTGKFLSLPPIVFIGKISYSLYLWHWPIIIFGKYYIIHDASSLDVLAWLAASFVIASLSWLFVENPFRSKSFLERPKIFVFAGTVMAMTAVVAGAVYFNNGFPNRFNSDQFTQIFSADTQWDKWRECNNSVVEDMGQLIVCDINPSEAGPTFLLWGDSHARSLVPAVEAAAKQAGLSGQMITRPTCLPLRGIDWVGERRCSDYNEIALQYINAHPELNTILLAGRWALSAEGTRYKNEGEANVVMIDRLGAAAKGQNAVLFDAGLDRTVSKLLTMDRRVVLVSSVPEIGYDVTSATFIALRTGRDLNALVAPTYDEYLQRNRVVSATLEALKARYNVTVLDPAADLCNGQICLAMADGRPLYRDTDHLTTFGALYISDIFNAFFDRLAISSQN